MGHLTDEEAARVKAAVAARRTPKTLVEGKWSVSPLNQDPAVIAQWGGGAMPERVTIRDITLRTAEQCAGVWLSKAQRRYLAEALIDAGVSSIQVAWLAVESDHDIAAEIALLKKLNPQVEIAVEGSSKAQAKVAADAGADIYNTYGPAIPEFHMIYGVYGRQILRAHRRGEDWRKTVAYPKDEAEHLRRQQEDVAYAKSLGLRAGMRVSMLHYATRESLLTFAKAAAEAEADEVGLNDGASGVSLDAWRYMVALVHEAIPHIPISIHAHNAFGLATAAAMVSFTAGAKVAEVAVNHLCSGAGQADLAEVVAAAEVLSGISTGVDLSKLTPLKELVEDLTGVPMAQNKAVTGSQTFTYTEEAMWEEEEYAPVHKSVSPELFGNVTRYALGRFSGVSGARFIQARLAEQGVKVADEQMTSVLARLKDAMEVRGRSLGEDELVDLARELVLRDGVAGALEGVGGRT